MHSQNIQGELYELSLKMIKKLDRYEFMPNEVIPRIEMITYNDTKKNQTILRPAMMYVKYYLLDDSYLKLPFISNYQSRGDHGLEFRERLVLRVNLIFFKLCFLIFFSSIVFIL